MSNKKNRGSVWLAAAGLVIQDGKWLMVKKNYGGLKGKWSIPAGFVNAGETVDEAAVREVKEETGMASRPVGILGVRTGVINHEISDNMVIFLLEPEGGSLIPQDREIQEAQFLSPEELRNDPATSVMVHHFLNEKESALLEHINPGDIFGYTSYKIFDNR
ncbi:MULTISPECIES: NUDIX hydrolase [Fictibacillus]|uniref:NUDIX hydrolase n=1 Tax=Fictibacillus enclensis TaxID=1017270 RepID=A0A0V8J947_9BACL|nr:MULTISPECIES: NUDIX hydrolase [Fictibacillus]KSU83434.1 NUDIX hydrolase [Fictibacillus enclensis]RXZ02252.1 NUDIX hydrolase [Fictibacillus sp. S7]SCC15410.1 ADP-ribose pyrophosphatase YjhB, NUDIX family [Fictibacillus enclensis]